MYYLYILVHNHKHGQTTYIFKSLNKSIKLNDQQTEYLVDVFKIEYEPDKGESLEVEQMGRLDDVMMITF